MIRMYKYRAFAPKNGRDAFAEAVALKRGMWADLCAMEAQWAPRFSLAETDEEKSALRKQRTAAVADIRRAWAARGLAWGDYNAVVFQFNGACRASAARGAMPADHEGALGEAVVRQLMGVVRPHNLLSRNDVALEYLPPGETHRRPGSRRSRYRTARLDFDIRTERNPAGAAAMALEFVMHRPLPANCAVVEVRIMRTLRPIVRRDGEAGASERWHVLFACRIEAPPAAVGEAVGIALDWSGAGESGTHALVVARGGRTREVLFGEDHLAAWERSRELFALADAEPDARAKAVRLAEALIMRRRLDAERRDRHRVIAAGIAQGAAAVAVPKTWLAGMGVKNFTAPAAFLIELKHALEKKGAALIRIKAKKAAFGSSKKLALFLQKQAEEAISAVREPELSEAAE